jgi:hypothetical protein
MSSSRALELKITRVSEAPWLKDIPKPPGYDENFATVRNLIRLLVTGNVSVFVCNLFLYVCVFIGERRVGRGN